MGRLLAAVIAAAAVIGVLAPGAAGAPASDGRIGPDLGLLNDGRQLHPFGTLVGLGQFPTGGALTRDGRFYWTVSAGRGFNDVRIVSLRTHRVVQTLPLPGASGGIAMDPVRPLAYVSGVADSDVGHKAQRSPRGRRGSTAM